MSLRFNGQVAISIHGFPNPNETNSYLTLWNIDPSVTSIAYGEANDGTWFMGPNKDGASITLGNTLEIRLIMASGMGI